MKKILLGTTAVVGASLLMAQAPQAAEAPTLKVAGWANSQVWWISEDNINTATVEYRDYAFRNDVEVNFKGSGKADNGLEYGMYVEFDAGQNQSDNGGSDTVDEANIYFKSPALGTIEFGGQDGVATRMSVYMPKGWGTGGADGDYDSVDEFAASGIVGQDFSLGDANKLTYMSPKFGGVDFGISFAPDNSEGEDVDGSNMRIKASGAGSTNREDELQAALRYSGTVNEVGISVGGTYVRGSPTQSRAANASSDTFESLNGWQAGIKLSFGGFTIGGGYLSQGDYGLEKTVTGAFKDDGRSWNVGLEYKAGDWTVGANFMDEKEEGSTANAGDDTAKAYGAGFKYNVASGFSVIGEVTFADIKNEGGGTGNETDTTAIVIGTKLSF